MTGQRRPSNLKKENMKDTPLNKEKLSPETQSILATFDLGDTLRFNSIYIKRLSNEIDGPPNLHHSTLSQLLTVNISLQETYRLAKSSKPSEESNQRQSNQTDENQPIEIKEVIGEGGMGIVYNAYQKKLDRYVAVKVLKRDQSDRQEIIKEARLMGKLSHPNIPPVHFLNLTGTARPEVVMKKLHGRTLQEWLEGRAAHGQKLREALKIMVQVCHAIEFAHNQGVLHRDIKTANIMLGGFNEVYLMDWGIAIEIEELETAREGVVGTTTYMATEMVLGDPKEQSTLTDIYLLGALLHTIITGTPRHNEVSLPLCLLTAYDSLPIQYSEEIPKELANLCNRACHKDPQFRPNSAKAFREELEGFLDFWETSIVISQAQKFKNDYIHMLNAGHHTESEQWDASHKAKYAFEQVLYLRPTLEEIRAERDGLLEIMIEQALKRKELHIARSLVRELHEEPLRKQFESKIETLIKHNQSRQAELIQLEREYDLHLTTEPRVLLSRVLIGSALFAMAVGYIGIDFDSKQLTPRHAFWIAFVGGLPILGSTFLLRHKLLVNTVGKQATKLVALTAISLLIHRYFSWKLGTHLKSIIINDLILISLGLCFSVPAVPKGFTLGVLGFLLAFLTSFTSTHIGSIIINLYFITFGSYILWSWRKQT